MYRQESGQRTQMIVSLQPQAFACFTLHRSGSEGEVAGLGLIKQVGSLDDATMHEISLALAIV